MKIDRKILSIFIILILLLLSFVTFKFINDKNKNQESQEDFAEDEISNNEESYEFLDESEEEKPHNLKLTIIGPEGETFSARQARMYNALAEGNGKYSNLVRCHWDFYLNENNEEVLYQTMDNSSVLSGESKEICGFTSTFIEKKGVLRVVLTATIYNAIEDLETITAERKYTVL